MFKTTLSAVARSPLACTLVLLLPFALTNPGFWWTVGFILRVVGAVGALAGSVAGFAALALAAYAGVRAVHAEVFRGWKGPALPTLADLAGHAIDAVGSILDRIAPIGGRGPLVPEAILLTDADLDARGIDLGALVSSLPTWDADTTYAVSCHPARPSVRLLSSWEERDARREAPAGWSEIEGGLEVLSLPLPVASEGKRIALPTVSVRPASIDPLDHEFALYRHSVRGDQGVVRYAPPARLEDVQPVDLSTRERVQVCANGPVGYPDRSGTTPPDYFAPVPEDTMLTDPEVAWSGDRREEPAPLPVEALPSSTPLPSDADLDAIALSDGAVRAMLLGYPMEALRRAAPSLRRVGGKNRTKASLADAIVASPDRAAILSRLPAR